MHLLPLLPLLLLSPLRADDALCIACCQNAGLVTCAPELHVYGEGSDSRADTDGFRVQGLWSLTCDGEVRFDAAAGVSTPARPLDGEVILTGVAPQLLPCFQRACTLPPGACLRSEVSRRVQLVDCLSGIPLSGDRLRRSDPVPQPVATNPPVQAAPVQAAPVQAAPIQAAPVQAAPVQAAPKAAPSVVIEVPSPPPSPRCSTPDALRTESLSRVEKGDEAARRGQLQRAVDEYRAALALDRCNGYAWAALGTVAGWTGQPDKAAAALAPAVQILPRHYNAWTDLGIAYEALGEIDRARESYRSALQARPGHQPAQEALNRLDRTRTP